MKVLSCILIGMMLTLSGVSAQTENTYPVILSSRWFHPTSPDDTLSTLNMVDIYKPDRIDWMYCTNDTQLAQLRARKIPYSLAINPLVPDSAGYTVHGRIVDAYGRKLVAPWMKNWNMTNANWGCANAPEFRDVFYKQSRLLIDLQAYGLFMDDARMNDHAMEWGGCFCAHCMTGFSDYLRANGADSLSPDFNFRAYVRSQGPGYSSKSSAPIAKAFRAFQTASVVRFLTDWRKAMTAYARRPLTFLTNNYSGNWTDIYRVFDVGVAELPENRVNRPYLEARLDNARRLGKQQYFTLSSDNEALQTKALFLTYSVGSALIIPWDVYVHAKSAQAPSRFFGSPDAYSPMYSLFKAESAPAPTARRTSSLRRAAPRSIQVVPVQSSDSVQTYVFSGTRQQVLQINATTQKQTHEIILKSDAALLPSSIQIISPNPATVRLRARKNGVSVRFPGDLLVLRILP